MQVLKNKVRDTNSEPVNKLQRAMLPMKPKTSLSVNRLRDLERRFLKTSGSAFAEARKQTLVSGQSVLQSEDGVIIEVFPNGSRREVKKIEKPTHVRRGLKLAIQ